MKKNVTRIAAVVGILAVAIWVGTSGSEEPVGEGVYWKKSGASTNEIKWSVITNSSPFFTLTNREHLSLEGGIVVRFSDEEWKVIAARYPKRIRTNSISFF